MIDTLELKSNTTAEKLNDPVYDHPFSILPKDLINGGFWEWDVKNNKIFLSTKWKKMLGYEDDELENNVTTWPKLIHPDEWEESLKITEQFMASDEQVLETDVRYKHKQGHYITARCLTYKIRHSSTSKVLRLVGYQFDASSHSKNTQDNKLNKNILKMIGSGLPAGDIYQMMTSSFESKYQGMRCSIFSLTNNVFSHIFSSNMPKEYNGFIYQLNTLPLDTSPIFPLVRGERVIASDIATDPSWSVMNQFLLASGINCCWSEPIKSSTGKVLGILNVYPHTSSLPTHDESEDLLFSALLVGLVLERDQNKKSFDSLLFIDELTKLHSRNYGRMLLNKLIFEHTENKTNFAVLYVDLDDFKLINDNFGHHVGDLHLKSIAKTLKKVSRSEHIISRLGGDEFCIVISDYENQNELEKIIYQYMDAISKPLIVANKDFVQSVSIGVARFPIDGVDAESLEKSADIALFQAKSKGKNNFIYFSPDQTFAVEYSFKLEQLLRKALAEKEIKVAYQPKYHLATGKIDGLEALCRWHSAEIGHVSPIEFIQIAEQRGLIGELTEQVLKIAFKQFKLWKDSGINLGHIAVNISPRLLVNHNLVQFIDNIAKNSNMDHGDIELEITESFFQTEKLALDTIRQLKAKGYRISIDDFGTGYSSLSSFKQMEIDVMKIDKSFIDDLVENPKSQQLVKSMIEMAHAFDYQVVVEGIETIEQKEILQRINCDFGQGYLLARPNSPEELLCTLLTSLK